MEPVKNGRRLSRRDIDKANVQYYQMGGRSADPSAAEGTSDFFMIDGEPMSTQQLMRLLRAEGYSGANIESVVKGLTPGLDPEGTYTPKGLSEAVALQQKGTKMPTDSQEYRQLSDMIRRLRGSQGKVFRHTMRGGASTPAGYMDPSRDVRNLLSGLSNFSRE